MPHRKPLLKKLEMDLRAARENDPAARGPWAFAEIILAYPGFHAIVMHRVTHLVWLAGIPLLPRMMSWFNRLVTGVDIHPGARIGGGFFIDHANGVVIGETAIVGENCTLFHQVTLGGTGKETGKRHPTLKSNVVVGTGAKILGNITIGNDVYVGANSVVLMDVPDNCTVVGIPGRVVKMAGQAVHPAKALDHIHLPDPVRDRLLDLQADIERLSHRMRDIELREGVAVDTNGESAGE